MSATPRRANVSVRPASGRFGRHADKAARAAIGRAVLRQQCGQALHDGLRRVQKLHLRRGLLEKSAQPGQMGGGKRAHIHARVLPQQRLHEGMNLGLRAGRVAQERAAFHQGHQSRGIDNAHGAARRFALHVGCNLRTADQRGHAQQRHFAAARERQRLPHWRIDAEHGHGAEGLQLLQHHDGRRVGSQHHSARAPVRQAGNGCAHHAPQFGMGFAAIGEAGAIGQVDHVLPRVALLDEPGHRVAADARVEHAHGRAQFLPLRRSVRSGAWAVCIKGPDSGAGHGAWNEWKKELEKANGDLRRNQSHQKYQTGEYSRVFASDSTSPTP